MAIKTITLKGKWSAPDGTPARGTVELALESPLGDDAGNITYTQEKKKYTLDSTGSISVPYIITGVINPVSGALSGTKVNVKEEFEDTKAYKWVTAFTELDITGTDEIWLADLSAVEPRPLNQYVLIGTYNNKMAEIATSINQINSDLLLKAPKASPTFTGTVTIPVASANTSAVQKLYVDNQDNLKADKANPSFTGTVDLSGSNLVTDTVGTKIGTATTQKLGFFNAAPVAQQASGTDLGTTLSNLGLRAVGTAYPLSTTGVVQVNGSFRRGTASINVATTLNVTTTANTLFVANASATQYLITLPSTTTAGYEFLLKKTDANTYPIMIVTAATGTIEGVASNPTTPTGYVLNAQFQYVRLISTATANQWYIVS